MKYNLKAFKLIQMKSTLSLYYSLAVFCTSLFSESNWMGCYHIQKDKYSRTYPGNKEVLISDSIIYTYHFHENGYAKLGQRDDGVKHLNHSWEGVWVERDGKIWYYLIHGDFVLLGAIFGELDEKGILVDYSVGSPFPEIKNCTLSRIECAGKIEHSLRQEEIIHFRAKLRTIIDSMTTKSTRRFPTEESFVSSVRKFVEVKDYAALFECFNLIGISTHEVSYTNTYCGLVMQTLGPEEISISKGSVEDFRLLMEGTVKSGATFPNGIDPKGCLWIGSKRGRSLRTYGTVNGEWCFIIPFIPLPDGP